jgi:hypothetical protein
MLRIACLLTVSVCLTLGSVGGSVAQSAAASETKETGVAILDFSYVNTSGEVRDEVAHGPRRRA